MSDLVKLGADLSAAIEVFLEKLNDRPHNVLTLDRKVGDHIIAIHDRMGCGQDVKVEVESDDDDVYVSAADLEGRLEKMEKTERINWNVLAKLLASCDFPRFLRRWTNHLLGHVVGRTNAETLSRDLQVLHKAIGLISECLGHSKFLRDALITDCAGEVRNLHRGCAYDTVSTIGCAVPLHFVLSNLPMLLSVSAEKLLDHSGESVDADKVTFLLSRRVQSRYDLSSGGQK